MIRTLQFLAVMCVAIAMAAGWAHLLALPNKIDLGREEYLVAQQIYRGWALLGVVIFAALGVTIVLAVRVRRQGARFWLTSAAGACIALALGVFFAFTYPANQATQNWTVLPDGWETLRAHWEYSHAVGAGLYFAALACLTLSLLVRR